MNTAPVIPPEILEELAATRVLMLVTGELTDGSAHYAYASIPLTNYLEFKQAEATGNYNLAAYGEILYHGAGLVPPAEVVQKMEAEHGASHLFEEQLGALLDDIQTSNS